MKYENGKAPLVCMMRQSTCYRQTGKMTVKGVLWHSTGANNPWLKRYVQPDDNDPDRARLLSLIGTNAYGNDWNHKEVQAGLNAWIGKLADGSVCAVQTMPWDYKPWGCGGGCNNGWIQFEICEDELFDGCYFEMVYREAVELTAYLCKQFEIDPWGKVGNVPTILCHQDSYQYGMGSNHQDVYHWFSRHGKTMDDVRRDVQALLDAEASADEDPSQTEEPGTVELPALPDGWCYVPLPILEIGDKSEAVRAAQYLLKGRGFPIGWMGADADFGDKTQSAVGKFQFDRAIERDGIIGPETWGKLICD